MTVVTLPKSGIALVFALAAAIVFALGVFGVHVGAVSGIRWADVGWFLLVVALIVP